MLLPNDKMVFFSKRNYWLFERHQRFCFYGTFYSPVTYNLKAEPGSAFMLLLKGDIKLFF